MDDPELCRHCILVGLLNDPDMDGSTDSDDYEIEGEIGRGGDGTVYLAFDRRVGRQVALKVISSSRASDEKVERRFRAEVDAIASLDHPNIIPIYVNGEMDGRLFYSMKYFEGGSLATRMGEFSSPTAAVPLMEKLARAVHHAHERGILHRDLKPSNILLGDGGEPCISDFGLAKRPAQDLDLTVSGAVMGTPGYMSPEQARGDRSAVTTTSDIFSLGSIFFELLTGRPAFEGNNSHVILRKVIDEVVRFPREETREVDRDLETVLMKCLEKEPEKRYPSALALAEDLARWQAGEPVEARRISVGGRMMRMVRRHPIPAGALAVALLSLIIGTGVSLSQWREAVVARGESESALELAEQARLNAEGARLIAEENAYYLSVSQALKAREGFEYGEVRRLLDSTNPAFRGFEWRLVDGLTRGDEEWSVSLGGRIPLHLVKDRDRIVLLTADRQFHEVNPETGKLTLLGELPETPGGSSVDIRHPGILHFSFSPDGRHYCFIDGDKLMIVDVASREIVFHGGANKNVSADATATWLDSDRLLTTGGAFYSVTNGEGGFRVSAWYYDLKTKEIVNLPPKGWVGPLATSPDGSRVAIGRSDHLVEVYRTDSDFEGEPEFRSDASENTMLEQVQFSPNGRSLAITWKGIRSSVRVYDLETKQKSMEQFWPTGTQVSFSRGSETLFVMGRESWFTSWRYGLPRSSDRVFDDGHSSGESYENEGPFGPPSGLLTRNTGDQRTTFFFGHHAPVISSISLAEDGALLTVSPDGTLKKWSLQTVREIKNRRNSVLTQHEYFHPTASQNGEFCLYHNSERRTELWHLPSGQATPLPLDQTGLAVFNDGRVLTRDDKSIEVVCWQQDGQGIFQELWRSLPEGWYQESNTYFIRSSTTPDERFVAILFWGRFITVDMETRTCHLTKDQVMVRGSSPGQSAAISPDGQRMAVTGFKGPQARIYQVNDPSGEQWRVVPDADYVTKDSACVYSHDGQKIYVGNNDGWVRVFDAVSLKEIPGESWQAHSSEVTAIALSQRGDIVATAGGEKVILWSTRKMPEQERRPRLSLLTGSNPRNWIQFAGGDTLLFHSGPARPIEIWEASTNGMD